MSLTLGEFRKLTEELHDDMQFVCAGAPIGILWHGDAHVSIDDEAANVEVPEGATVLYDERCVDDEEDDSQAAFRAGQRLAELELNLSSHPKAKLLKILMKQMVDSMQAPALSQAFAGYRDICRAASGTDRQQAQTGPADASVDEAIQEIDLEEHYADTRLQEAKAEHAKTLANLRKRREALRDDMTF
jgi:hypothetical protein